MVCLCFPACFVGLGSVFDSVGFGLSVVCVCMYVCMYVSYVTLCYVMLC